MPLYVTTRVKQLVLLRHAARFTQEVLPLLIDLVGASTIRLGIHDSKG
jgi:hypothetical protein